MRYFNDEGRLFLIQERGSIVEQGILNIYRISNIIGWKTDFLIVLMIQDTGCETDEVAQRFLDEFNVPNTDLD